MNITVVGAGYVGLSISTLLAATESTDNNVTLIDVNPYKVENINNRITPFKDDYIERYFKERKLNLTATTSNESYATADFIIIVVPTNYDEHTKKFDTRLIEGVITDAMTMGTHATFVIKSTIPIGYCDKLYNKFEGIKLIVSPEFLRETCALFDNLYPSRIIVGCPQHLHYEANTFINLLLNATEGKDAPLLIVGLREAECIKLFANTYLAMRVAFFNELDTYSIANNLNTKDIIEGVSLDPRIGNKYNNPSFGYGGYCLPKDTKQLLANYEADNVPQHIISAIVKSNETRKHFIVQEIIKKNPKVVGIYKLSMKKGSDSFRESAIVDITKELQSKGITVVVYEPSVDFSQDVLINYVKSVEVLCKVSDIVIANRYDADDLDKFKDKVYTRDLFNID